MSVHSVVALPPSPYEGLEVDYHPSGSLATGPVWRCVWRSALNSGSGAWAVVSGAPLTSFVTTGQTTTSTSYVDLATVGPAVAIDYAGDYIIRIEADLRNSAANTSVMSFAGPGVAAGGEPVALKDGTIRHNVSALGPVTFTGAGAVVAKYTVSAGTGTFQRRRMALWPVELRP